MNLLIILAFVLGLYLDSRLQKIIKEREFASAECFCSHCKKLLRSPRGSIRYDQEGRKYYVEIASCLSCGRDWLNISFFGGVQEFLENRQITYPKQSEGGSKK